MAAQREDSERIGFGQAFKRNSPRNAGVWQRSRRSDLQRFEDFEARVRSGAEKLHSQSWNAPILAGGRVWDVTEYRLVRRYQSPVVCQCFIDVTERRRGDFIHFIVNFYWTGFENGDFSLANPDLIWLHARLHVREHLVMNQQKRARSRANLPVIFDCWGSKE